MIPARLRRVYRATLYEVDGIAVRVGRRASGLDALGRCMVLVTAWNPMSRRMPLGWNRRMQRRLVARLRRFQVWVAQGAFRQWHEEHVAVVCDPRLVAHIGRVFRQRALVVVRRGQAARVVVLG